MNRTLRSLIPAIAMALTTGVPAIAQQQLECDVDLAWNRFYDFPELERAMAALAEAHPGLCRLGTRAESAAKAGVKGDGRLMVLVKTKPAKKVSFRASHS